MGGFFSPGDPRLLLLPAVVGDAPAAAAAAVLLLSNALEIIPPVLAEVFVPVPPDDRCAAMLRFGWRLVLLLLMWFALVPLPGPLLLLLLLLRLFKLVEEVE